VELWIEEELATDSFLSLLSLGVVKVVVVVLVLVPGKVLKVVPPFRKRVLGTSTMGFLQVDQ
jgi:hypothetical protein